MRGLWRAIALIAEDASSFNSRLASIASQVTRPNLTNDIPLSTPPEAPLSFKLQPQPTPAVLQAIDSYLRSIDKTLILSAYELAEVNRTACEAKTNEVPPNKSLKAYWQGLDVVGRDNRDTPGFMEAVGGLAIDGWTRSQFAAKRLNLTDFFSITNAQQESLRSKMLAGSASDLAAQVFALLSWPRKCTPVVTMSADWTHFNA